MNPQRHKAAQFRSTGAEELTPCCKILLRVSPLAQVNSSPSRPNSKERKRTQNRPHRLRNDLTKINRRAFKPFAGSIEGAFDSDSWPIQNMGVDHRRADIFMA